MWINSLTTSIGSNTGGPRITDGDLEYSSSLSLQYYSAPKIRKIINLQPQQDENAYE